MTADRRRALVQRPGRKAHFATIAAGEASWLSVCDRDVPVFGATVLATEWVDVLLAAKADTADLCSRCRTPLLVAALALDEVEDVRAQNADRVALLERVRRLEGVVRAYADRILSAPGSTSPARDREQRHEAAVDRRLRRAGL